MNHTTLIEKKISVIITILIGTGLLINTGIPLGKTTNANDFLNKYIEQNTSGIQLNFSFNTPLLKNTILYNKSFSSISLQDFLNYGKPGKPCLPIKPINILLPPGTTLKKIDAAGDLKELNGSFLIEPGGTVIATDNSNNHSKLFIDTETYNSSEPYPGKIFEINYLEYFRGYSILSINLFPVQYKPQQKMIYYYENINLSIETEKSNQNGLYRGLQRDKNLIKEKVVNPNMTDMYPIKNISYDTYEYVIITTKSLETGFQQLIDYKSQYTTTKMVDLTYINSEFSGNDSQEKIRNFIKFAYLNWGTEYILLGGDDNLLPHRGLWGSVYDETDNKWYNTSDIPADIYYAGLDGNWDNDGDKIYGEDSYNSNADEADWFAEVYVGRVPANTLDEVNNFIYKLIKFEASIKPKAVLLHQSRFEPDNIPDSRAIPNNCGKWITDNTYKINKLYEENENVTIEKWVDCFTKSYSDFMFFVNATRLNEPWPLIILHTGHGNANYYLLHNDNLGYGCSWFVGFVKTFLDGEKEHEPFDIFPIHLSVSCNSGDFTYSGGKCLGEDFLLTKNAGASACIFHSNYSFYSITNASDYSGRFYERQFYQLFQNKLEQLGKITQLSKEDLAYLATNDTTYRWCYYTINLLGDPETPVLTKRGEYIDIEKITGRLFRVTAVLKNNGEHDLTNILWIIGFCRFLPGIAGGDTDSSISSLKVGQSQIISTLQGTNAGLLFGFSFIDIFIIAKTQYSNTIWLVKEGYLLGPFVILNA